MTNKNDKDGLTQSERFMQAARDLECDDDPERFKERVRKVAKSKSAGDERQSKRKTRNDA